MQLKILVGIALIPDVIQLVLLVFIPETPKYLYAVTNSRSYWPALLADPAKGKVCEQVRKDVKATETAIRFYQGPASAVPDVVRQVEWESGKVGCDKTVQSSDSGGSRDGFGRKGDTALAVLHSSPPDGDSDWFVSLDLVSW